MQMCHIWNRTTAPSNACNFGFRYSYNILRGFKLCGITLRFHEYQTRTLRISHPKNYRLLFKCKDIFFAYCTIYTIAGEVAGKTGYLTKTTPSLVFLDRIVKKLKLKQEMSLKRLG